MAYFPRGVNKYRNVKTQVDGIIFDSKAEARRYAELDLLQKAGEIKDLKCQPKYPLMCGDRPIRTRNKNGRPHSISYLADFEYRTKIGELVVEDVKGMDTRVSSLKRAILEAQYGIRVRIIRYR